MQQQSIRLSKQQFTPLMLVSLGIILLLMSFASSVLAQPASQKPEDIYNWRVQQEELNGVYIPKDLAECFTELDKKISKMSKVKFKDMDENTAMEKLHYSLGRWIWYNWGFYEGSRLSVYMNKVGVHDPEDMASFIIVAYHRHLNSQPLEPQKLAEMLNERRKKEKERRKKEFDDAQG